MTKFGEILVQLRQEKHLSQAELGLIIYVFAQTVSDDTTVGDVVQSLQRLSPARKRAACTMVADMEVASMIHIARKRERA